MVTQPRQIQLLATKPGEKTQVFIADERNVKDVRAQLNQEGWSIRSSSYADAHPETQVKFTREAEKVEFGDKAASKVTKQKETYTLDIDGSTVPVSKGVAEKIQKEVIPEQERQRQEQEKQAQISKSFGESLQKSKPQPVTSIKKEYGYGQEMSIKEVPPVIRQPGSTQIPESQRVYTEIEVPNRQTVGGYVPTLKMEEPRSTFQTKRQANIMVASAVGGVFATPIIAGIAGSSAAAASTVSVVGKGLTMSSLGLSGLAIATAPKEERKYVIGDVMAGLFGATVGGLAGSQLITPKEPQLVKVKSLKVTEEKVKSGKTIQKSELAYEPAKEMIIGEPGKTLQFDYKEMENIGKIGKIESGSGIAGRENRFLIEGGPQVSTVKVDVKGFGAGVLARPGKDIKTMEYIFDKPITIDQSDIPGAFISPTKQLGALKPFPSMGIKSPLPNVPIIPMPVLPKIDMKKAGEAFATVSIKGKSPMTGMAVTVGAKQKKQTQQGYVYSMDEIYSAPGSPLVSVLPSVPQMTQPVIQISPKAETRKTVSSGLAIGSLVSTGQTTELQKSLGQDMANMTSQMQSPMQASVIGLDLGLSTIQVPMQSSISSSITRTSTSQMMMTRQMQDLMTQQIPQAPNVPFFKLPRFPKKGEKLYSFTPTGFDVELRKAGEWFRATREPLLKSEAFKLGAFMAETTPRASFRLVPSMKEPSLQKIPYMFNPQRFRAPKRKGIKDPMGDIYIEKEKLRINTPGELRGITFAPRKKISKTKRRKRK